MKRLVMFALLVGMTWVVQGCGDDNEMKNRCLEWCGVFQRCVPDKPVEFTQCQSSCNLFDDPDSAEEFEALFLCKEKCVNDASGDAECTCLLAPADGGPDC